MMAAPLGSLLWFGKLPEATWTVTASNRMLIIAGLLVGFGTRLGSGCMSGHGVCGLASVVKIAVSTLTFIATRRHRGYASRHLLGGMP